MFGTSFLVTNDQEESRRQDLQENGFELLNHISDFGIYQVHGTPTMIKERNERGQVVSVTTVDENGNPVNGDNGYAKVSYEYDRDGNIIREFRTDTEGNGVADSNGQAGYEREYNGQYRLAMERYLGPDGKPILNGQNYAEYRREYKGSDLVRESYYDTDGKPVNRLDIQYASKTMQYDGLHHVIQEQYYDREGVLTASSSGYACVRRQYQDNRMVKELYFDSDDNPRTISSGYAGLSRSYDQQGNILSEEFLDETGHLVDQLNGYAREERLYDDNNNLICQKYFNAQGEPVVIYAGYSEIRKTYDGYRRVIKEEYYALGVPAVQPAGHTAIENAYDEEGYLIVRRYLDADGALIRRVDGYSEARWIPDENETTRNVSFYTEDGESVSIEGINLIRDMKTGPDGWSAWMTPVVNGVNSCFDIGVVNLGDKQAGDTYTCQIEIEFSGVTATEGQQLRFWAQGAQDGKWYTGNVWDGSLISLTEAPEDGVYIFTSTREVNEDMAMVSTFGVGFRCDYWGSGSFRVRNVKIEKGSTKSEWSPGE